MREIRFRAWNKIEQKMEPICGISWDMGKIEDYNIGGMGWGVSYHKNSEDYELMQFTGLLDKNGKEIYEGDIIMDPSWWWGPGFVFLDVGECGPSKGDSVMQYALGKHIDNPKHGATFNIWNGKDVEVIGNIHENPEMLK